MVLGVWAAGVGVGGPVLLLLGGRLLGQPGFSASLPPASLEAPSTSPDSRPTKA